jgi:acyl carrier protein
MGIHKTLEEIREATRKFILDNYLFGYKDEDLKDDASLLDMGAIDSTGVIELVVFMEEEFSIIVDNSEILPENLDSIDCIVSYVYGKQKMAVGE